MEILRLQEENKRLLDLLTTETSMPLIEKDPEIPELLNAGLLYEPSALKRAYHVVKCALWTCDWVVTVNLEQAERIYLNKDKHKDNENYYVDEGIFFWCKTQCRHCKRVGKESRSFECYSCEVSSVTIEKSRELERYFKRRHSKLKKDGNPKL